MKKWNIILTILLFILGALCYIFFEAKPITILEDALANKLLCGFIARTGIGLLFIWLLYQSRGRRLLLFDYSFPRALVWALPCFMVAFVNFPYSALINGTASITRVDLMGLYILYVFGISLIEELVFRGTILILIADLLTNKRHKPLLTVLFSALVFALFHLTNIFVGADIGYTLLQCVYTFLIGAMLSMVMLKSHNVWLCILIHTIFDFGGLIIFNIGVGDPWDLTFWILTIVSGLLCAGHVIFSLIKLEKDYVSR